MKYRLLKVRNIRNKYTTYHSNVSSVAKRCCCTPGCVYNAIKQNKICNYEFEITVLCTDYPQCMYLKNERMVVKHRIIGIQKDVHKEVQEIPEWFDNLFGEPIV